MSVNIPRRPTAICLVIVLALWAVACGGSSSSGDATQTAGSPSVPQSLAFLGGIPVAEEAATVTFDEEAGSFDFADGTAVVVPAGAFAGPTEVETVLVDLDFDQYAPDQLDGVAYVLATADDVPLDAPIELDLAVEGSVHQLRDGEWVTLAGPTVTIEHFSEVPTVVVSGEPAGDLPEDVVEGFNDAEFLFVCIQFLGNTVLFDAEGARGLGVQLAYQICTRALIERHAPGDVVVSTDCVGAKIDAMDVRAAIDECAAQARAEPTPASEPSSGGGDRDLGGGPAVSPPSDDDLPEPEATEAPAPIELTGSFDRTNGALEQTVTNELTVTVAPDGAVSGEGTIVTRTTGTVEATGCFYDYEWQGDFTVSGELTDTLGPGGGTMAELTLTSTQRHNANRSDPDCPVQIVEPTAETTAAAELVLTDSATMTATIEPVTPSPFVHIPSFEVAER